MPDRHPLISVVAPCHNEASNLEPLHQALTSNLGSTEWEYELVLVDDGSTDGTWPTIRRIAQGDRRVHGIRLARSFGQQAAILAGLRLALLRFLLRLRALLPLLRLWLALLRFLFWLLALLPRFRLRLALG